MSELPGDGQLKPLAQLLDNWGTDTQQSDMNADGIVNGQDLAMLLAGASNRSMSLEDGFQSSAYADRLFDIFGRMGFKDAPPSNLGQVIDGLNIHPINAKTLTIDLLGQYNQT